MNLGAPPQHLHDESTLPVDLTSFVGRRAEVSEVKRLLTAVRLVTLTGVGGVGKTRLASRVAAEMHRRFADGVTWVPLGDLRDPSLLAQAVEDRLAISERVGRDPRAIVVNHLRRRTMLLVLDNAEHLLDACAELVDDLLQSAPGLRILVTSRQALNVGGERPLAVAPLLVPTPDQAREPGAGVVFPSLALFQDRAEASVAGFAITPDNQAAVADICRKLAGIPLAIELATVKLRVLSVEQLADRLDARLDMLSNRSRSVPTRHQTLQATIDWSFDLCTPQERLLWARASVFAGGFGVEAAEACCADEELTESEIVDTLAGLVDKSILVRSETNGIPRFKLLEPLREHGLSELQQRSELQSAHEKHLDWCSALIAEACRQWFGPTQERWCVTLQTEKANIRAAAEHSLSRPGGSETTLALVGDPWFLWVALFLDEGRHWLDRALTSSTEPTPARAKALATAGYVAALQGDLETVDRFLDESRGIAEALGSRAGMAYATHVRGLCELFREPSRATAYLTEGLELYEEVGEEVFDDYVIGLRVQLGLALLFERRRDEAEEQFAICERLCSMTGERWLFSYARFGQAFINFANGRFAEALALAREAVAVKRFFGDTLGLAVTIDLIAWIHAADGRPKEAATMLGAVSRLWDLIGLPLFGAPHWLEPRVHAIEVCTSALGDSAYAAAYESGTGMSREVAMAFACDETADCEEPEDLAPTTLTPREREIAELVWEGLSNKAIAQRLVIAQRTAEGHVENILTKFGFHSRTQIAAWVAEHRTLT